MTTDPRRLAALLVATGAAMGAIAVMAGAFGTHTLRAWATPERLATFETGARYAMYHALALVGVGVAVAAELAAPRAAVWAGGLFAAGVVLFSGSLWLLVLHDAPWLGAVAPLGGACLIGGWGALVVAAARYRNTPGSTGLPGV